MTLDSQIPLLPKPPKPWLTLLMGAILLVSGIVTGAGGTVIFVKHQLEQPDRAPDRFNKKLVQRMTRDLNLTQQQEENMHKIFRQHRKEMHNLFENMQSEVEQILTPEQARIWKNRVRQYDSRGERDGRDDRDGRPPRRHDGPPPPPDHRPPRDDFDRDSRFDQQRDDRNRPLREDFERRPSQRQRDGQRDSYNDQRRPDRSQDRQLPPPQ